LNKIQNEKSMIHILSKKVKKIEDICE